MSGTASHPDKWALTSKGGSCSALGWVLHLPALQSPDHCGTIHNGIPFSIPFRNSPKGILTLSCVPMAAVCTAPGLMAVVLVAKAISLIEGLGLLCTWNKLIFTKG